MTTVKQRGLVPVVIGMLALMGLWFYLWGTATMQNEPAQDTTSQDCTKPTEAQDDKASSSDEDTASLSQFTGERERRTGLSEEEVEKIEVPSIGEFYERS